MHANNIYYYMLNGLSISASMHANNIYYYMLNGLSISGSMHANNIYYYMLNGNRIAKISWAVFDGNALCVENVK